MIEETSTEHAPWHLIPANNKPFGRIAAFRILADRLGANVPLEPRPIDPDLLKEAKAALRLTASEVERALLPGKVKAKVKPAIGDAAGPWSSRWDASDASSRARASPNAATVARS